MIFAEACHSIIIIIIYEKISPKTARSRKLTDYLFV